MIDRDAIYLDTETTGLDPIAHDVWEVAWAIGDGPIRSDFVPHDLSTADDVSLDVGRYQERCGTPDPYADLNLRAALKDRTVVSANAHFDASFLYQRWGVAPWNYRLWDLEAYAAGVLDLDTVPGLARVVSVLRDYGYQGIPDPDHTAAGDVATVRACFKALRGFRRPKAGVVCTCGWGRFNLPHVACCPAREVRS